MTQNHPEDDLESLIASASAGVEEDNADTSFMFDQNPERVTAEKTEPVVVAETHDEPKTVELEDQTIEAAATELEPVVETDDEIIEEEHVPTRAMTEEAEPVNEIEQPVLQPVEEPKPEPFLSVKEAPQPVAETSKPVAVTGDISLIRVVLRIAEVRNSLGDSEKLAVAQFINPGKDLSDEAEFIDSVLNHVDPHLQSVMGDLKTIKGLDLREQAFFAMGLDQDAIQRLGTMLEMMTGQKIDPNKQGLAYVREVVSLVDHLDDNTTQYVEATERVLQAAGSAS